MRGGSLSRRRRGGSRNKGRRGIVDEITHTRIPGSDAARFDGSICPQIALIFAELISHGWRDAGDRRAKRERHRYCTADSCVSCAFT